MYVKSLSLAASTLLFAAAPAFAGLDGLWKTSGNDDGAYLIVDFQPCGDKVCGTITEAFGPDGAADPDYVNIGRQMVTGMTPDGPNKWTDGKIWRPDTDETFDASIEVKGDEFVLEGCRLIFCREVTWTRAQ